MNDDELRKPLWHRIQVLSVKVVVTALDETTGEILLGEAPCNRDDIYLFYGSLLKKTDEATKALCSEIQPETGYVEALTEVYSLRQEKNIAQCEECEGSGRTNNHVTGEVECSSCEGTGTHLEEE